MPEGSQALCDQLGQPKAPNALHRLIKRQYFARYENATLLLKFDFTSQTDNYYISINNGAKTIVGAYTSQTFKYLCAKLSDLLYPHGILVIPCKNNIIAFDTRIITIQGEKRII